MNINVHADDFGRTKGINRYMTSCLREGVISSISISTTGPGFEDGIKLLKQQFHHISVNLHLDLVEGPPLSNPRKIPLLVDANGNFFRSLPKMWLFYHRVNKKTQTLLRKQIKNEIILQIKKFQKALPNYPLKIDSHQHFHLLPFISDVILDIHSQYHINHIRLTKEPFFFTSHRVQDTMLAYAGPNVLKHFILKYLSHKLEKKLMRDHISYNPYFIGALYTGYMNYNAVQKALTKLPPNAQVQILLHPCKAAKNEQHYWKHLPGLHHYYHSPYRDQENQLALSPLFKKLVAQYQL